MFEFIVSLIKKERPDKIILSSVRFFSEQNLSFLRESCTELIIFDDELKKKYELPEYLTPDRAASIIASRHLFKGKECMIFDFGTTLSVDFIDNSGLFEGGNVWTKWEKGARYANISRTSPIGKMNNSCKIKYSYKQINHKQVDSADE